MKTIFGPLVIVAAAIAVPAAAQTGGAAQGDAARAKAKVSMCIGCHGIPAYRTAYPDVYHVPMIAGQTPEYLVKALEAYKTGERNHPSMRGIAKSLSDQDMADLAAYYAAGK